MQAIPLTLDGLPPAARLNQALSWVVDRQLSNCLTATVGYRRLHLRPTTLHCIHGKSEGVAWTKTFGKLALRVLHRNAESLHTRIQLDWHNVIANSGYTLVITTLSSSTGTRT
eukprot:2915367-Amphidinium_carterae.1